MENLPAQTLLEAITFGALIFLSVFFCYLWRLKRNAFSKVLSEHIQHQKKMADLFFRWQEGLELGRERASQQSLSVALRYSGHFKEMHQTIQDDLHLTPQRLKKVKRIFSDMSLLPSEIMLAVGEDEFIRNNKMLPLLELFSNFQNSIANGYGSISFELTLSNPCKKLPDGFQAGILRLLFRLSQFTFVTTGSNNSVVSFHFDKDTCYLFYQNTEVIYNEKLLESVIVIAKDLTTAENIQLSPEGMKIIFPMEFLRFCS